MYCSCTFYSDLRSFFIVSSRGCNARPVFFPSLCFGIWLNFSLFHLEVRGSPRTLILSELRKLPFVVAGSSLWHSVCVCLSVIASVCLSLLQRIISGLEIFSFILAPYTAVDPVHKGLCKWVKAGWAEWKDFFLQSRWIEFGSGTISTGKTVLTWDGRTRLIRPLARSEWVISFERDVYRTGNWIIESTQSYVCVFQ